MGYYIFFYGINTKEVRSVFGSKDQNLLRSIKASDTFDNYKDFLPKGFSTTPEKALEEIINNEPYEKENLEINLIV
jgi:hypothetical protein